MNISVNLSTSIYLSQTLPAWTHSVFPGGEFSRLRSLVFTLDTATPTMARYIYSTHVSTLYLNISIHNYT